MKKIKRKKGFKRPEQKLNHLTYYTGHTRVSSIDEIQPEIFNKIVEYYNEKKAHVLDNFWVEFKSDKEFILTYKNELNILKGKLIFKEDKAYNSIKENFDIDDRYPVLAIDMIAKTEEEMFQFSKCADWAGDFERCVGHYLLKIRK